MLPYLPRFFDITHSVLGRKIKNASKLLTAVSKFDIAFGYIIACVCVYQKRFCQEYRNIFFIAFLASSYITLFYDITVSLITWRILQSASHLEVGSWLKEQSSVFMHSVVNHWEK